MIFPSGGKRKVSISSCPGEVQFLLLIKFVRIRSWSVLEVVNNPKFLPSSIHPENMNNNNHSNSNDKSQVKDMRSRRSPSQERATGSPSYSNGGQAVNCSGNGNGLLGGHATESNSSRGSNCSIGSSASSTSSRGGGTGEHSDRSSSREDRPTTPNCNKIVVTKLLDE